MVEQVTINPTEVRGYGNVCEEHSLDDFTVNVSSLSKVSETVHGALTNTYKLLYSVYGLMFDFDKGAKQLYLQTNEADTLSLGFDTVNKQLYLVDENDTGFSLGFDEDTNELYVTDDAPPIVHNYSLALDQSSYTTTGSLSVSATLLDNGVAVSGATVSFTGGVSTVTATTNSSGVATATVNFTSSGTLTASYSNVSDTASVTVSHNYSLAFSSSSYVATDGSAEVSVTLLDDNVAVSGATVSVAGSDSSLYSGLTNSSGIATITVENISSETTFTATYSNATATCTVTVSNIIFQDDCSSADGLSNYGSIVTLENNSNATLTYNSTENAYALACTGSGVKVFPITDLNGLDSFKLTMELKMPSRTGVCGGVACINATEHTGVGGVIERNNGLGSNVHFFENNGWKSNDSTTFSTSDYTHYYKLEMTVNGYDVTWKWYDYQDNLLRTVNKTLNTMSTDFTTLSERGYGLDIGWSSNSTYPLFVRNIKAEYI